MSSKRPRNTVERAAEAAFRAVEASLENDGAKAKRIYIALLAEGAGKPDAVSAVSFDGSRNPDVGDVLAFLLNEASGVAKAVGLEIKVFPMGAGHG